MKDVFKDPFTPTEDVDCEHKEEYFAQLFADVIPLKSRNKVFFKKPIKNLSSFCISQSSKVRYIALDSIDLLDVPISYLRSDCDKNLLRKLRKNAYTIGDQIDIHGCNRFEAQEALSHFFAQTKASCVLVIHGRGLTVNGRPILKTVARAWLMQQEFVLAYCEAKPNNGGDGAVKVLVKKLA